MRGANAHETRCKLIEVRLADEERAGRDEARDDRGVGVRDARECGAARGRRDAGHVDVVFHREGNAVKRQRCGVRALLLQERGRLAHRLLIEVDPGAFSIVAVRPDARQNLVGDLLGAKVPLRIDLPEERKRERSLAKGFGHGAEDA